MKMDEQAYIKRIRQLESRVEALEQSIENNQSRVHQSFHIEHIETMNIQELAYHLGKVDVKQLSGTMNIGTTFPPAKTRHQAKAGRNPPDEISIQINGKQLPYKIRHNHQESPEPEMPLSATFSIGDIQIGAVEDASAVNFGNNFPTGFKSLKKHNQGFGTILGDGNDIHDIFSHQEESGSTEVFSENPDEPQPEWLNWLKNEQKNEENEEDETGEPE
ncbi:hypothetical protein [Metabacillus sp. 84]|uniref:hypothetical protein n=1 Tax=unclassified Metabacillus TaxID=2675274 RepID=UPI003CF04219